METYRIANGLEIPAVGLGTWKIRDRQEMRAVLSAAIAAGYRLFDTAAAYSNEIVLGSAIKECAVPRERIFIQDKLWNTQCGYEQAFSACKRSLKKLKLDYLDAYLIHYPATSKLTEGWREVNQETWRALETLYQEGYVRAIGLCNFGVTELEQLVKNAHIVPMLHQIEYHPGMTQEKQQVIAYSMQKGMLLQAASPLMNGRLLSRPELLEMAARYQKSCAQIILRWILDKHIAVLPKSVDPQKLWENLNIFDYTLSEEDSRTIDEIRFCGSINAEIAE